MASRELVAFVDQQGPNANDPKTEGMAQGTSEQRKKDSLGKGHFCTLKRRYTLLWIGPKYYRQTV